MRLRPTARSRRGAVSLRWQLTAWVAGVLLVCAAIVFTVVLLNTGSQLRSQIDHDLSARTTALAHALRPRRARGTRTLQTAARAYVRAQPYSATSPILFVLFQNGELVSNQPELFGLTRPERGETSAEQAEENARVMRLRTPRLGFSEARLPDVGRIRMLERRPGAGDASVTVGAGEPLAPVERAQHSLARAFALAGGITLVVALVASYLAGARVSAPLRRMASVARRVDAGDLGPRMPIRTGGGGREVDVLAEAFNHMLDRLSIAFAGQREFIADASHELRTPLTVIRGQLEVLAADPNPKAEEVRRVERLLQAEIDRVGRLVEDLLLLARAEQREFLQPQEIPLQRFVTDLWDGLSLAASRRFELGPIPEGSLSADPDRLAQALRNLAANAIAHTNADTGLVRLDVRARGAGDVAFVVSDDGAGIPPEERQRVFERFHRTDAGRSRSAGGAGLGLAIVRAIAEAHGGGVAATEPDRGTGGRLELWLPGFSPGSAA